jgi:hypothetical protein
MQNKLMDIRPLLEDLHRATPAFALRKIEGVKCQPQSACLRYNSSHGFGNRSFSGDSFSQNSAAVPVSTTSITIASLLLDLPSSHYAIHKECSPACWQTLLIPP